MDFATAFDKVSDTRLLHKLHMYGTDPEACGWSRSFLCSRTQSIVVDGEASKEEITSSVPQGSVLVPIFFLIFTKDMIKNTKHSSDCLQTTPSYTSPLLLKMTVKKSKTSKLWRGWRLTG